MTLDVFGDGGTPFNMIIGPPGTDGLYDNATSSFDQNHEPSVLLSGTFTITIPGVSATSQISDVSFEFGTGPDSTHETVTLLPPPPAVPDGAPTVMLLGAIVTGIALIRWKIAAR